jgi:N6-adenosine-specific RNA methylase IME4
VKYRTIVADPPWPQQTVGKFRGKHSAPPKLPYPTMTLDAIKALPVADYAAPDAHLWLWTTNAHLFDAFDVLRAWGFTYLTTITWVKPSGFGAWFASTTQHCLFGYREKCVFPGRRYAPTHFHAAPKRHSAKPEQFYQLAEEVSAPARLELFARRRRLGWDVWGNEVESTIALAAD